MKKKKEASHKDDEEQWNKLGSNISLIIQSTQTTSLHCVLFVFLPRKFFFIIHKGGTLEKIIENKRKLPW